MAETLLDLIDAVEREQEAGSIAGQFRAFHEATPHVWEHIERFALEAARAGEKFGAKAVWERMRWHIRIETTESHKLNKNYTSRYARLSEERYPQDAHSVETRKLWGEGSAA